VEEAFFGFYACAPFIQGDVPLEMWQECPEDGAGASLFGKFEGAVWSPGDVVLLRDDIFQDVFKIHHADPLCNPLLAHFFKGECPCFFVVGEHEVTRNALAEDFKNPLAEVAAPAGRALTGAVETDEAIKEDGRRQIPEIILEGIGDKAVAEANPACADVVQVTFFKEAVKEVVKIFVVGKKDMAPDIPREAPVIFEACRKAADILVCLIDVEMVIAEFLQAPGAAKPCRSRPDYCNVIFAHRQLSEISEIIVRNKKDIFGLAERMRQPKNEQRLCVGARQPSESRVARPDIPPDFFVKIEVLLLIFCYRVFMKNKLLRSNTMKLKPWAVNLVLVIAGMALAALNVTGARAQSSTPREETWVTDGTVRAVVRTTDTVYIGGDFTYVGPATGGGVPLDVSTGAPVATFPKVNGTVSSCVPDGSGGWFIGGGFDRVAGIVRNNIAHILANGSVDPGWNPNASGTVYALTVSGSTIYAGGGFWSIGGQVRNYIAALDAATGTVTDWNPNASDEVHAIAVSGSTVYAGGLFTSIGGQTRNYIAAIDATTTGAATAWNPNASGRVSAIAVSGTTIYAGGGFTTIGGRMRNNIAALAAATGVAATDWNPNADDIVYALAVSGSTIYAGGGFTSIGGQARNYIAALDATTTGAATDWKPYADGAVFVLAVSGSTVYAGGGFTTIGGQMRNRIAALDATTGNANTWNPNANFWVQALAVSGSTVYAGGRFTSIGGQTRNHIAALDATTGAATDWNPSASSEVRALAVSGSTVYAGGSFWSIGGQIRDYIAALDVSTGVATNWNPNVNGYVYALAVSGSTVYAGGYFTSIGGQTRNNIAALNTAATGAATAWNPNADNYVYALAVSGSTVYAGGEFTFIGGQTRNYIAAIDTTDTGTVTIWNPDANNYVYALAVSGSTVYAGGQFTSIGRQVRNNIAALDATTTGTATDWNPNADNFVLALAVSGSTIYAGGGFTSIGGQSRTFIAALDASTGAASDWNPNASEWVYALAVSGSTVYAGGNFRGIGDDRTRFGFAQFDPEVTPTPTPTPTPPPTYTPIPTPTPTPSPTPTPFVPRPHLVGAVFSDADGDGNAEPGEALTLVFDQGVTITQSLITPDCFYLHVAGDSLGLAGFSASMYNSRQLTLILGQGAHLTIEGYFLTTMAQSGSPSGIDLSVARLPFAIRSLDELVDSIDLGDPNLNDTGLDIKYSFKTVVKDIGSVGGTLDTSGDPDAAYHHSFYVPPGSISSSSKVKAEPDIQFTMKSPEIPPPPPGCDTPPPPGGAIQILANADNITFLTSATLTLEYLDSDVNTDMGFAEAGMRINMCVQGEDGCWHWVPVPGEQIVDTENNTVTVHLWHLAGATGGVRLASPGDFGIYGNLPGATVEESTINIKPQGGGMARILVGPTLAPGAGGYYTWHRIEFPNYVVTNSTDPNVIKVSIKQSALEGAAQSGGNSFPKDSNALFVILTKNVSNVGVPFNAPVNIRVQFMDGTVINPPFKDIWKFNNTAGTFGSMSLVKDTVPGTGVNFQFIQGVTQSITPITGGGYVEGAGITGLTDSYGKGVWGLVSIVVYTDTAPSADWTKLYTTDDLFINAFDGVFYIATQTTLGGSVGASGHATKSVWSYWNAPATAAPYVANQVYRAKYTMHTTQTDKNKVPNIRMLIQCTDSTASHNYAFAGGNRLGKGPSAPTIAPKVYSVYFGPMDVSTLIPAIQNVTLSWELIDFATDEDGTNYLDSVVVERFATPAKSAGTPVATFLASSGGFAGWTSFKLTQVSGNPFYGDVTFVGPNTNGVSIQTPADVDASGHVNWGQWSPISSGVTFAASKLYRTVYTLSADRQNLGKVRLINNNVGGSWSAELDADSYAYTAQMPTTGAGKEYDVWQESMPTLYSGADAAKNAMTFLFDVTDGNAAQYGTTVLSKVEVLSYSIP